MGGARLESLAPSVARRGGASLVIAKAVHAALPPVMARAQAPLCASRPHVELDGAVVQAGAGPRAAAPAANAGECCARCTAHRGCNVWVFCREASWCAGQCWLKQAEAGTNPRNVRVRAQGESVPWESGTLDKDWIDPARPLPAVDVSISAIALRTAHGDIVLRLMPDWSLPSVDYLRRMAAGLPTQHDVCTQCEFYRTEVRCTIRDGCRVCITWKCAHDAYACVRAHGPGAGWVSRSAALLARSAARIPPTGRPAWPCSGKHRDTEGPEAHGARRGRLGGRRTRSRLLHLPRCSTGSALRTRPHGYVSVRMRGARAHACARIRVCVLTPRLHCPVFARVADEASMQLIERIVAMPSSTPGGPNTMRFLDERPQITVLPASVAASI